MVKLLQWWDNFRYPNQLTIREVERLVDLFVDRLDEDQKRALFTCHACAHLGIKLTKLQSLADWAYDEGIFAARWINQAGVFHFADTDSVQRVRNQSWMTQRLELLDNYLDWLYMQEGGDEI